MLNNQCAILLKIKIKATAMIGIQLAPTHKTTQTCPNNQPNNHPNNHPTSYSNTRPCMYTHKHMHVYTRIHARTHAARTHACMHACTHMHACMHARMHARMHACMHACMHVSIYFYLETYYMIDGSAIRSSIVRIHRKNLHVCLKNILYYISNTERWDIMIYLGKRSCIHNKSEKFQYYVYLQYTTQLHFNYMFWRDRNNLITKTGKGMFFFGTGSKYVFIMSTCIINKLRLQFNAFYTDGLYDIILVRFGISINKSYIYIYLIIRFTGLLKRFCLSK